MKYRFTMRAIADTLRRDAKWISASVFGWGAWHGEAMAAVAAVVVYVVTFVVAFCFDVYGGRN